MAAGAPDRSMGSMKTPTLIAGTAVIGIAIGFVAGNTRGERAAAPRNEVAENSPRMKSSRRAEGLAGSAGKGDGVTSGSIKGREYSKMSAAEALVMVKANGESWGGGDPLEMARRNYEFQLMLSKLPLGELEELIALSQESGVQSYRARQIFGVYAARNLEKAMAWAATQPDADSWKSSAVAALAANDPGRAMEMYQDVILNGTANSYGGAMDGGYGLAGSFAKQGTTAFLQFIDSIPSGGADNYISNSMRNLPKEDLPGFMAELEKRVKEGKFDQALMGRTLQSLASTDPELARSLIGKMEEGPERAKREMGFGGALAQQGKTAEALELMKSAMAQQPGGKEKEFVINEASSYLMSGNPAFALLVAELPPGSELNVEDVKKISDRMWRADPVNMAKLLKTPEDQVTYLEGAIDTLGKRGSKLNAVDFRVLEHRLLSLGLTGDHLATVQEKLAATRETALGK